MIVLLQHMEDLPGALEVIQTYQTTCAIIKVDAAEDQYSLESQSTAKETRISGSSVM